MNSLSLFSGAGGGLLGEKLLGWRHLGYVEYNEYCQKVIKQRIKDGFLDEAPIFGDIRAFIDQGYAESYKGMVDVVTAGFPCQPFSVAGKCAAADDPRNMWPATMEVVRIIRPRFCYFENVPGLLSATVDDETTGLVQYYFGEILRDLAESGYSVRWRCLSAAETGAPHKRDRVWIIANAKHRGLQEREHEQGACGKENEREHERDKDNGVSPSAQTTNPQRGERSLGISSGRDGRVGKYFSRDGGWEITTKPVLYRGNNGVAHRVDRLKALGNGQVPQCMVAAWHLLTK